MVSGWLRQLAIDAPITQTPQIQSGVQSRKKLPQRKSAQSAHLRQSAEGATFTNVQAIQYLKPLLLRLKEIQLYQLAQ